jgi:hypothetical protein
MLGRNSSSSSSASSFDTGSSRGVIVRNSKEFGPWIIGRPSEECDDRGEGVNLGELPSVSKDADSCGLRWDEEGMFSSFRTGSRKAKDVGCVTSKRTWLREKEVDSINVSGLEDVRAVNGHDPRGDDALDPVHATVGTPQLPLSEFHQHSSCCQTVSRVAEEVGNKTVKALATESRS